MTARDRIVLIVVGARSPLLAAFWFLAISPKRKEAADLSAQVAAAQTRLDAAQAVASSAEARQGQLRHRLRDGRPPGQGRAGRRRHAVARLPARARPRTANHVDFRSIKLDRHRRAGAARAAGAAAAVASADGTTPGATPRPAAAARCRPARPSAPPASRRCRSRSTSRARSSTCSAS